jgi:carbonic anhydrase/acetyltransferase-like protein (isoleucine patch superfamily)
MEYDNIIEVGGKAPEIDPTVYVDPSARIIGEVIVEQGAAVYPGVIIRAEGARVWIRRNAVVLDMSFIESSPDSEVVVGEATLVSHRVMVHGAQIWSSSLIGIGSILLDRAVIGKECIVSAGSLVPPRKSIADRSLVVGSPVKVKRTLVETDIERIRSHHKDAWINGRAYGAIYGAQAMDDLTSGMGNIGVDSEIFGDGPSKLDSKLKRGFKRESFDNI